MKYLLHLALISVLLSGCADTPLKEASIEDRMLTSSIVKGDGSATTPTEKESATAATAGTSNADIYQRALTANSGKPKTTNGVETHGLVTQSPEGTALGGAGATTGTTEQIAAAGQSDSADALKFVAQPVLDPKDPQSPLAQRRLLFDYDSSAIRDEYRALLEMHAEYLKQEKSARIILQGHADERGSREYNLALGQRRSESVFNALNLLGVPDEQMEAVSLGEEKPVAEGNDENAWAQNRRAEILYQGE